MLRAVRMAMVAAALVLFVAAPALADPPGNNGTVKIDGVPFENLQNNEPHVGCQFEVTFWGYDEGDLWASATFDLHAPTKDGTLVTQKAFIGEDPAGGGTDHDATIDVDLSQALFDSGVAPQPNQGYHVYMTVHADGSIGADVKHKVFWVQCSSYPPVPVTGQLTNGRVASAQPFDDAGASRARLLLIVGALLLTVGVVRTGVVRRLRARSQS
jgi:hypothetical protein